MEDKRKSGCLHRGNYRPLSLIKGNGRHGERRHAGRSFVTRNIDSAFICNPSVCCVNGPHGVSWHKVVDEVRSRLWCVLSARGISLVRADGQPWAAESGAPWYSLDTLSGPGSAQVEPAAQNTDPSMNRTSEFKGRYMFHK